MTNNWEDHLAVQHFSVEGQLELKAIFSSPSGQFLIISGSCYELTLYRRAPFNIFESKKKRNDIKPYVRCVFVVNDCKDLFPGYFKGVIESEDLLLNIPRETLQHKKILRENIVKKLLSEIGENQDYFAKFYEAFDQTFELGIDGNPLNHSELAEFLRFFSMSTEEQVSLKGMYRCSVF